MKKEKSLQLELIRIIAIFFVIFNHTRAHGFDLYKYVDNSSITFFLSYAMSIICKTAVPLFFMVSGVTLLDREEDMKAYFFHRILRIILVIFVFTLLQYIRLIIAGKASFNLITYFVYCFCGNIIEPYWFLKAYLGFLLAVPFLRKIVKGEDAAIKKYLVVLCGISIVISLVYIYLGYYVNVNFVFCMDILLYPLLGYFCRDMKVRKSGCAISLVIIWIVNVCLACGYHSRLNSFSDSFLSVFCVPLSVLIFLIVNNMRLSGKSSKWFLGNFGSAVFGVYLIEDVLRNLFEFRLFGGWNFDLINPLLSAVCFAVIVQISGLWLIWLVRKIPGVSKLF